MDKKQKFYFDPNTLSYKKIERKKTRTFGYAILFLLASLLFGFLMFVILINTDYFQTPNSKIQSRELDNYKIQYRILNRKLEKLEKVLAQVEDRDNNIYRAYFNSDPIPEEQRKAGFGGVNRYKELEGYNNSELVINTAKRIDILTKQLAIQSKSLDEIIKLGKSKEKFLAAIPAIQPVKNEDLTRMASGFGYRSDPFTKARKMHTGMDFTAPTGTPVFATGNGIVNKADNSLSGYGNLVVITHGYKYETYYAHLSKFNVKHGQKVNRGDIIGFIGSTGRSQAPHLHYEVRVGGLPVNPINYYYGDISAEEFVKISEISKQANQSLD